MKSWSVRRKRRGNGMNKIRGSEMRKSRRGRW